MTSDVISHLWQSTVAGAAVLGILTACDRLSAGTRRIVGWMGLAKFAVPAAGVAALFSGIHVLPEGWSQRQAALLFPVPVPASLFSQAPSPAMPASPSPAGIAVAAIVGTVWLGVAALLLGMWIVRGLRLRRHILAQSRPVSPELEERIAAAARRAGLARPPRCLVTDDGQGPGTLGILSPVVILPSAIEDRLGPAELESVLIHEFVHVRRGDTRWSVVQTLFVCLFWFDPIVWMLSRQVSEDTEKSCDEKVLEITSDPGAYADGILKALRLSLGLPQPGFAEAAAMPVVSRVNSILAADDRRDRPVARRAAVWSACLLVVLSGYAGSLVIKAAKGRPDAPTRGSTLDGAAAPSAEPRTTLGLTLVEAPASDRDVFDPVDLDRNPVPLLPLVQVPSDPAAELARLGGSGGVLVEFVVDPTGAVSEVRAVDAPNTPLVKAALETVARWKFQPGIKDGRTVSTRMRVAVPFGPATAGAGKAGS
jgi:TonB family protein